ncbi:MAG TPA: hypothetical protein VED17_05425 [Nitrososphaerales archaeon]|nr:hypothetical protein [Nitrososphaerales archaeon]
MKNLSESKEVRTFGQSKIGLVNLAGNTIGRFTLQKGRKWSNDIKPVVKTERCEAIHVQYIISGKYHVKMKDGSEFDLGISDGFLFHLVVNIRALVIIGLRGESRQLVPLTV